MHFCVLLLFSGIQRAPLGLQLAQGVLFSCSEAPQLHPVDRIVIAALFCLCGEEVPANCLFLDNSKINGLTLLILAELPTLQPVKRWEHTILTLGQGAPFPAIGLGRRDADQHKSLPVPRLSPLPNQWDIPYWCSSNALLVCLAHAVDGQLHHQLQRASCFKKRKLTGKILPTWF